MLNAFSGRCGLPLSARKNPAGAPQDDAIGKHAGTERARNDGNLDRLEPAAHPSIAPCDGLPKADVAIAIDAPERHPLPRYITHDAWFAGALACEAAIYAGCVIGTGLMLPAALMGVTVGGPLRYAQTRWNTLRGLRALAGMRPWVSTQRWEAMELLSRPHQTSIAQAVHGWPQRMQDPERLLSVLCDLPQDVLAPLRATLRRFHQAPNMEHVSTMQTLEKLASLPQEHLAAVVAWAPQAPRALLSWLLESYGTIFRGKAAWLFESAATFEALHQALNNRWACEIVVDTVLQTQQIPAVDAVLEAARGLQPFDQLVWFNEAFAYMVTLGIDERDQFLRLITGVRDIVPAVLNVPENFRGPLVASLLHIREDQIRGRQPFNAISFFERMAISPAFLRVITQDLIARPNPSYAEINMWQRVVPTTGATYDFALEMRAAGMPMVLVAERLQAFLGKSQADRDGVLKRYNALAEHQSWPPAQLFDFVAPLTHEDSLARLQQVQVSLDVATALIALTEPQWQVASQYPDDLHDMHWIAWVRAQSELTLQALHPAAQTSSVTRVEAVLRAQHGMGVDRATVAALEARAPSLLWLIQMSRAHAAVPKGILQACDDLQQLPAAQQLGVVRALAKLDTRSFMRDYLLFTLALMRDPSDPSFYALLPNCRAMRATFELWSPKAQQDIKRLFATFALNFSTWSVEDRKMLLQGCTALAPYGFYNYNSQTTYDRDGLKKSLRQHLRQRADEVLQALAWVQEPAQAIPSIDATYVWDRANQTDARLQALTTTCPQDTRDPLVVWAALARQAPELAETLSAGISIPLHEKYFVLQQGRFDARNMANRMFASVENALTEAAQAWGGRGPLPSYLRRFILDTCALPNEERSDICDRDPGTMMRLTNADGLHRLFSMSERMRLPQPLDAAFRVAALDVLDPPQSTEPAQSGHCVSYGCETSATEAHTKLAGCSCGTTLCNGCAKDALTATPDVQTCRSDPKCGAPLTREYLERLDVPATDAIARRMRHYREKLQRVSGFDLDVQRTQTLHGQLMAQPVYTARDIPPLPERVDPVAMRMLLRGLAHSPNINGVMVERECYHCGQPVQKDDRCLHMGPQSGHMHGDWDFERGAYDHGGCVRWAHFGLGPQQYIPLAPGPLARAHFYDGLPAGVMTRTIRARVDKRREAWLRALDGRASGR